MTSSTRPAINLDSRVRISPDVLVQPAGDESVLLDLVGESYFGLNEVGTKCWQRLEAEPALRGAYDALLTEFDVPEARLEQDLVALVEKLVDAGLVSIE